MEGVKDAFQETLAPAGCLDGHGHPSEARARGLISQRTGKAYAALRMSFRCCGSPHAGRGRGEGGRGALLPPLPAILCRRGSSPSLVPHGPGRVSEVLVTETECRASCLV